MEFSIREVKQIARNLLDVNPNSGTGLLLLGLAKQAESKGHYTFKSELSCVIFAVRTARQSMVECIAMYAD